LRQIKALAKGDGQWCAEALLWSVPELTPEEVGIK